MEPILNRSLRSVWGNNVELGRTSAVIGLLAEQTLAAIAKSAIAARHARTDFLSAAVHKPKSKPVLEASVKNSMRPVAQGKVQPPKYDA